MPTFERNLAILGSPSVGKSALTTRFVEDKFVDYYDPTIQKQFQHKVKNQKNHVEYDLTIYDTAGLERQSQIQTKYIDSNGFILVYSIVDRQSFDLVKHVYEKIVDELNGEKWGFYSLFFLFFLRIYVYIGIFLCILSFSKPIILIGNKSDLSDQRRVTRDEGEQMANSMNAAFVETSARIGEVRFVF